MNEDPTKQFQESEKEQKKEGFIALAKELSESHESFSFPGIDPESYATLKSAEEEFLGYTTPIDTLIERFENEGMKIALGEYPDSGNVFVVPSGSDDIENDSVFPRHLQIDETMDERLKQLISLQKFLQ